MLGRPPAQSNLRLQRSYRWGSGFLQVKCDVIRAMICDRVCAVARVDRAINASPVGQNADMCESAGDGHAGAIF